MFGGHSLGSGIAALMTILVVNHRDQFGGIPREQVRCYALAPARCMSLNLAVKYADVINSVVLQDDFLPRTPTPLEYIFGSIFCLPCLLFMVCLRDTFIPERRKLKDQRRLYAPGRMYHIVERKFCRCGRFPPEVRTAIPVEGRFEHIVLSCTATSDHAILWIAREAEKALELMKKETGPTDPPAQQTMERRQTLEKEHRDALVRAVSLNVPYAVAPKEDSNDGNEPSPSNKPDPDEDVVNEGSHCNNPDEACYSKSPPRKLDEDNEASPSKKPNESETDIKVEVTTSLSQPSRGANWDKLVEGLFTRNEYGQMVMKKDADVSS